MREKLTNQYTINLSDNHALMLEQQATRDNRRHGEYIRLLLIPELEKRNGGIKQ